MASPYAELTLYFAYTSTYSGDLGTGNFFPNDKSPFAVNRRLIAMDHIHRAMDSGLLKYGVEGCLWDEGKAAALIQYAERRIPGTQGIIELSDCLHGAVRFYRKIRFLDFTEGREEELLRKIRKSRMKFQRCSDSLEKCLHFFNGWY